MISETKTYDSFPIENFLIGGFSKLGGYRLDRDALVGGVFYMLGKISHQTYLRWKQNQFSCTGFYVEINLHNDIWFINCSYNPPNNMIGNHLRALSEKLDINSLSYNNFIILDDFNIEVEEQQIKPFYDNYGLSSLTRQPTSTKIQVIRLALT